MYDQFKTNARQNETELLRFVELLKRERVNSFLEVGSKHGGNLWRIATALPAGSRIVSVDLPWGDQSTLPHLQGCILELKARAYDAHLFIGDSTDPAIITQVKALGPYDAVFVDANHTLPYVTKDWQNYGPMGRLVAFHDIAWKRENLPAHKMPINVPEFWRSIKDGFRHQEISEQPRDNGIGVLWQA